MKKVIFIIEHTHDGVTFRPEDGQTTITSDLALTWAALGIVEIIGDGCGCGDTSAPEQPAEPKAAKKKS